MTPSAPPQFRGVWLTGLRARSAYSEGAGPYRILPMAVAVPATRDDLVALLRWGRAERVPLVPRGAGSGMPGGNVGRGVIVDLQQLDATVEIRDDGTAVVGASATWQHLDEAAGRVGLRLPPNPSSGAFCTLGGMVSTNASGARSVAAGSIRRWVAGLEILTADGDIGWIRRRTSPPSTLAALQRFERDAAPLIHANADTIQAAFPRTSKNSSGYALDAYLATGDSLDLLVGAEGTLALVLKAALTLERRPDGVAGMMIGLGAVEMLGEVVARLLGFGPSAVELLDRTFLDFASVALPMDGPRPDAVLLVEFEGHTSVEAAAALAAASRSVAGLVTGVAHAHEAHRLADLWAIRHAASPALARLPETQRSLQIIEDGCVPIPELGAYLAGVRTAAEQAGVAIVAFGHAGDGHVHVNALADMSDPTVAHRLDRLYRAVNALVIDLGGTPSGEHGDGRLRAPLMEQLYGTDIVGVFRAVKRAFDPAGVLNPGVILTQSRDASWDDLKAGAGAVSIPDDVAGRLREVERSGGWAISKLDLVGAREGE